MDMVMDAHETGFRLVPLDLFSQKNEIIDIIDPQINLDEGIRHAARYIGIHYDFAGLFGVSWVLLGRALRCRWKNPFQSSDSVFCSESIVRALQHIGFPGSELLDPEGTTPDQLRKFLTLYLEGLKAQQALKAQKVKKVLAGKRSGKSKA
jgi:hypothetical protein